MMKYLLSFVLLLLTQEGIGSETDRMIAYVGNWQACPTSEQTASYTELLIAFAVTYQWAPGKNTCNTQCVIGSPVPICNNKPNAPLVSQWQSEGKKVILSFGGAGMGGSWSSSVDDCWDYCYGKEDFVVEQLVNIVSVQGFDGVDIDYEYYYENGQKGSSFSKGAEAQKFLREVTQKLRAQLPAGKIVSHAPMDSDMVKGTGYYNVIKSVAGDLDFLMPQYYNGLVRPETAFTSNDQKALTHYTDLVDDVFSGDGTKMTFGFCISDCPGYNTQSSTAVQVVQRMKSHFPCNGGVFFWVANHDTSGLWSKAVAAELGSNCGGNTTPRPPTTSTPTLPTSPPVTTPRPPTTSPPVPSPIGSETDRMIAYVGNWQACPTSEQTASYTELLIAFAVTYQWAPGKNTCNTQCVIGSPVPICNNKPNAPLVSQWQSEGKKVILSFGGAGMGGSWSSSVDDCWDYCYGKEDFVVEQLVNIVSVQGFDGVDIDYEYYYENGQKGSSFSKGAEAQKFLREVTQKLRAQLPAGKIVSHAPMDSDMVKGTGYYNVIKSVAGDLDFLMPQYYNGLVRPETAFTSNDQKALTHYTDLVDDVFSGDGTKMTFGFCISDCPGYNTQSSTAVQVVQRMKSHFPCNGGVFFWVANHDTSGLWSKAVAAELGSNCGGNTTPRPPTTSTPTLPTSPPVTTPRPPTTSPPVPSPTAAVTPRPASGVQCNIWNSCSATPDCCPTGTSCYNQDQHYAQCRPSCPSNWACSNQTPKPPTATPMPPTATNAPVPTPEPTDAPVPTPEPTDAPVPTPEPTDAPVPTPEPTDAPVPTPEPTDAPLPTPEPTDAPTPKPTDATPKPTSSAGKTGVHLCSDRIAEWGGCSAAPYCCADGLTCFEQSEWYAQCGKTCSGGSCKDLGKLKDVSELGELGQEAPVCNNCLSWQNNDVYCTGSGGCNTIPNSGTCMAGDSKCFGSSDAAEGARKVITFVLKNGVSAFDRSEFERLIHSCLRDPAAKVLLKYLCPSSVCPGGVCADPFGGASKCFSLFDISAGRISILEGNTAEGSVVGFEIEGSDEGLVSSYNEKQLPGVVSMHEEWQSAGYDGSEDGSSTVNSSLLTALIATVAAVVGCVLMAVGVTFYKRTHQNAAPTAGSVEIAFDGDDEVLATEADALSKTTTANEHDYQFQI